MGDAKMSDIRFSGFGGQGVIRCSLITGKAISLFDNKHAAMTQSFGPEARGGACSSQLVISENRVLYPYIVKAEILVAMSQEAYSTYEPQMCDDGILIIDEDLVKPMPTRADIMRFAVPATRMAEQLGNRIFANLIMLGFFTVITKVVSPQAMKKALPGLVPDRFLDINITAFDKGYAHGEMVLSDSSVAATHRDTRTASATAARRPKRRKSVPRQPEVIK